MDTFGIKKKRKGNNKGGNPNIRNLPKTGPKTKEGKLRSLISTGRMRPWSKSKIIKHFRKCDRCPLRTRMDKRVIKENGKEKVMEVTVPASCKSYKEGSKCVIEQGEFINKLDFFFRIGQEKNSLELQKMITYSMLENAELAKEAEMLTNRSPGHYTNKFQESAAKNIESYNKMVHGEKQKIEGSFEHKVATLDINKLIEEERDKEEKEE